ncbi:MAG: hypothetical protein O3B91_09695 [Actinomycetota bacterium]|nr:hypothetical protein [Actinomycetota bacterium]MDA3020087.1 hypothetical protein [Actinomycetota bacterium]
MRRLCEKPGCGQPVAVIYGLAPSGTEAGLWVDHWSPERIEEVPPPGARGVVCQKHSESLSAPLGWSFEDRREAIPRLFKTRNRGKLSAVPEPTTETPRPKDDSTGSLKRGVTGASKRDVTKSAKRPRPADIPRPSLFAELDEPVVEIKPVVGTPVAAVSVPEVSVVVEEVIEEEVIEIPPTRDDSTELLIRQDADTRWAPHFDPDDDLGGMLDATGSMLRDAFRSRHNGRRDQ